MRRLWAIVVGALGAALGVIGIGAWWRSRQESRASDELALRLASKVVRAAKEGHKRDVISATEAGVSGTNRAIDEAEKTANSGVSFVGYDDQLRSQR